MIFATFLDLNDPELDVQVDKSCASCSAEADYIAEILDTDPVPVCTDHADDLRGKIEDRLQKQTTRPGVDVYTARNRKEATIFALAMQSGDAAAFLDVIDGAEEVIVR